MRPARGSSPLALLPLLAVLLAPVGARGQTVAPNPTPNPPATIRDVQAAERTRAAALAAQKDAAARVAKAAVEEQRLAQARVAAAETLRITEVATAEAANRMDALAAKRRDAEARLERRAETLQRLLPLIERLSMYPAETLLTVPASPENRLRGLLVLRSLSRELELEAKGLRRDQADAEVASASIAAETPKLAANLAAQAARAAELDRLIAETQDQRRLAETAADSAAQRAAAEAARADTLRAALAALETQRKAEEARAHEEAIHADRQKHAGVAAAARQREAALAHPPGSLSTGGQARGHLALPVAGKLIRAFGDTTDAGPATGMSYQVPPNARVIAPCTGKIAFADKFRTYGQLLIVDCGGGYHAVLSGLDRLDAKVGQAVQAGEPVGTMPNWEPGGTGRRPALYMELRHDGQPVDPAPWLRGTG